LHNARAIVSDLREIGDELWRRFNSDRSDQLWYYGQLALAYPEAVPISLREELERTVSEMCDLAERNWS
jgi:hypothetical protein